MNVPEKKPRKTRWGRKAAQAEEPAEVKVKPAMVIDKEIGTEEYDTK